MAEPVQFDPAAFDAFKKVQAPVDAPAFDPAAFDAIKKAQAPAEKPLVNAPLDVAKSAGTGLIHGGLDFAGGAGALRNAASGATDYVGNALGFKPEQVQGFKDTASTVANHAGPYGTILANAPSPEQLQAKLEGVTGPLYKPQTTEGRYAKAVTEAVGNPASYFGPGGLIAKALMAGASGAGGEAAADAAEGTGYEGLARLAGSVAAGPLAGRAVKPQLGGAQQTLADAGVRQTPGQLMGGMGKDIEDKLTSVPILGHFIQNSRGRSVDSFNRAVANQALEPIGERIAPRTAAGHEMVAEVERKLGDQYDRLLPHLQFAPDRQYWTDINNIHQNQVRMLPQPQAEQFERILDTKLGPAIAAPRQVVGTPGTPRNANQPMTGTALKKVESDLNRIATNYSSSSDAAQRDLGSALTDVVRAMRANIQRVNPAHAEQLQNINSGWAMYARIRDAAAARKAGEGVFLPSDLLGAVKKGDKSVGKGAFARGDALMQDFAEAGQSVLPSKVPDSGTAGRSIMAMVGAGGLGYVNPKILAGVLGASSLYTRPVQALINRWASPTQGARNAYAEAGRGAGALRPLALNPFGDHGQNPYQP